MKILISICTKHRIDSLIKTLHDISACNFSGHQVELLIVANEEDGVTRNALDKFPYPVPIHFIETGGCLANARNATLTHLRNSCSKDTLVINTDDDVSPHTEWLNAMASTAETHGDKYIYGGRIVPVIPDGMDDKLFNVFMNSKFCAPLYAAYQPVEGTGQTDEIPFGPNFAFFLSTLEDQQYPTDLGPGTKKPSLGEETEFLWAFVNRGHGIIYCHESVLMHRIRPEQLSQEWIMNRAVLWGRSSALDLIQRRPHKLNKPKKLQLRMWSHRLASWLFYFYNTRYILHKFRAQYYATLQDELKNIGPLALNAGKRSS